MKDVVFDFESAGIEPLPDYPPKPCGLAIMVDDVPIFGTDQFYNAWGHPLENNCDEDIVVSAVKELIDDPETHWTAHNLAFDAGIIEGKWGLKFPYDRSTDTMLLAFMADPYGELSLKPLCQKLLGLEPTERDAVREWLVAHGICSANDKSWGAHISKAPGNLVGAYAHGDITRTKALRDYLRKQA